jgi:chromosome segregation ATPase
MGTPIPGASGKTRDLDGDTILDLSAIHGIMYNAADELGLSQDARVHGMEAWLKAVEKQPQMWFDLVQRCNKTLLAHQVENKELTKILDEARGMLTTDKDGNLVHLIADMQDVLTAGLGLLVARPEDPQEVTDGDLVELIKELNDTLANRQGDIDRLEDEAASNTQTENAEFVKLTSDFDKLSAQYNSMSGKLADNRDSLNNRVEELKAANEQGKKWQEAYHDHRTKLGELATRT